MDHGQQLELQLKGYCSGPIVAATPPLARFTMSASVKESRW